MMTKTFRQVAQETRDAVEMLENFCNARCLFFDKMGALAISIKALPREDVLEGNRLTKDCLAALKKLRAIRRKLGNAPIAYEKVPTFLQAAEEHRNHETYEGNLLAKIKELHGALAAELKINQKQDDFLLGPEAIRLFRELQELRSA